MLGSSVTKVSEEISEYITISCGDSKSLDFNGEAWIALYRNASLRAREATVEDFQEFVLSHNWDEDWNGYLGTPDSDKRFVRSYFDSMVEKNYGRFSFLSRFIFMVFFLFQTYYGACRI
jgi:hypothetical protein